MGVLNGVYKAAAWRGTTPYHADTDRMGICFDLPDGQVVRLAISRESATHLVGAIADYLPGIGSQPSMSPEIPGVAGLNSESGVDAMAKLIRFSLSRNEAGDIEVYSCQSRTALVLPVRDVDLLIDGIRGFLNDETERETISLCPISGRCESDRT